IVGVAEPNDKKHGRPVYNTAAFLADGAIRQRIRKRLLPTYDVFDEARYFEAAQRQPVVRHNGVTLGISICEDMWSREELLARPLYDADPLADLVADGAELLINISASPYFIGKHNVRAKLFRDHVDSLKTPLVFVNQIGGNDELIFDGASCVVLPGRTNVVQMPAFCENVLDYDNAVDAADHKSVALPKHPAVLRDALVLGLRDYARKCGFRSVVLGLSGGIDSAVVAALAAEALGPEHVHGVAMPSRHSSTHSVEDAQQLSKNLGIHFQTIPIEEMHAAFERELQPAFAGRAPDVTEENIQARVRGVTLMSLSNKFGHLLLTTGNKSELAVGYCTLYGDMCGGLAVISDVPKTMVYELARFMNKDAGRALIPENTITKPPSAELRPGQQDSDSLPDYTILDEILHRYEERMQSAGEIIAAGFDAALVTRIIKMIHRSEYKRQQAAPGLKITSRAFGFGRRMPIAAKA
ncbi:MAG: NAD+ synthase, partial [Phycisphaerae bacterium]